MHQTFYIDIDEEITSVVERLRKARASEIALVVPKRALLIQSIVNLRLLKKEADNLGLSIMVVTQDKLGKLLVEKAGILVQQKFDELDQDEVTVVDLPEGETKISDSEGKEDDIRTQGEENDRLARIGSDNYFDKLNKSDLPEIRKRTPIDIERTPEPMEQKEGVSERITNKELVTGVSKEIRDISKYRPIVDSMGRENKANVPEKKPVSFYSGFSQPEASLSQIEGKKDYLPQTGQKFSYQDKKIENFFSHQNSAKIDAEKDPETENPKDYKKIEKADTADKPAKSKIIFLMFGFSLALIIILVLGYFVLPKATLAIVTKSKFRAEQINIDGSADISEIDFEKEIIPLELVSVSEELVKTFPVSGEKKVSNQKAKGKVTLYNEFSSSPQSLVATTRLLSEDGKLFRLVKGVTIPGTKKEGEKTVAGTTEAEVAADESGEDFNISPAKFTIPGFKDGGNGKYEKIYAQSEKAMTGGGSGTDSAKTLSQEDIDKAKEEISSQLDSFIAEKILEKSGVGKKSLEGLLKKGEPTYKVSNSPGEVVSNFEIRIQVEAEGLVFKEIDAKKTAGKILAKSMDGQDNFSPDSIELEYASSRANFDEKTAEIKVLAKGKISLNIDRESLRKGILGKTNEELEVYLGNYPDIEKVEVTYWPPFFSSRIPLWDKRVMVEIN